MHKQIPCPERATVLAAFTARDGTALRRRVLVATDLAGRGLDLAGATHVLQYDMALDMMAYIHRAGRTGRAGHPGHVCSLVMQAPTGNEVGEDQGDRVATAAALALVAAIERCVARGEPLTSLFSRNRSFRKQHRKERASNSDTPTSRQGQRP